MHTPRNAKRSHPHGASPVAVPASKRSTKDWHRHPPVLPIGLQKRSNGSFFFGVLLLFLIVETSFAKDSNEGEELEDWLELLATLIEVLIFPAFGIIFLAMANAHEQDKIFLLEWKGASQTQTAQVTSRQIRYTRRILREHDPGCCRRERIDHLTIEYTVVSEHNHDVNDPCDDEECPSTNSRTTVRCRARSLVVNQEGDDNNDELRIMVHPHYLLSGMTLFDFYHGLEAKKNFQGYVFGFDRCQCTGHFIYAHHCVY